MNQPEYTDLGETAIAQILMEQLIAIEQLDKPGPQYSAVGAMPVYPKAGQQPDPLTMTRLNELFAPNLIETAIDLDKANTVAPLGPFIGSNTAYVALVKSGVYGGMVTPSKMYGLVLQQLLADRDS